MVECTLFMTHCLRLNLQLHTISLVRTCRISSFCTVAWQLARRIVRSLGDSWASCVESVDDVQLYMCCTESNAMSKVSCMLNSVTAGASILTDTSCKVLSSPLRLWASLFYSHCLPKCLSSETGSTKCCKYCRDTIGVFKSLTVSVFVWFVDIVIDACLKGIPRCCEVMIVALCCCCRRCVS